MRALFCKRSARLISVFLILVFLMCACGVSGGTVVSFRVNDTVIDTAPSGAAVYHTSASALKVVAKDETTALLFDDRSGAVGVADVSSGRLWTSLTVAGDLPAYALELTVACKEGRYRLNSQDHAAAFSESLENGVRVTYTFSDRAETAQKTADKLDAGELQVIVPVEYRLQDGNLAVAVNAEEIAVSKGFFLEKLSVLPFFGALCYGVSAPDNTLFVRNLFSVSSADFNNAAPAAEAPRDDYLFLPDGCGAVLYPKLAEAAYADLTYRVSPAAGDGTPVASIGAFGVQRGNAAFVCTVTEGLALTDVRSVLYSAGDETLRTAFAEFILTPSFSVGERSFYGAMYTGRLQLVYRFLSGYRANYIAMADAIRETMIRAGLFRDRQLQTGDVPLLLSVLCAVTGKDDPVPTEFAQIEDLLSLVKAKGVDNVQLILQGMFPDGILQNASTRLTPAKLLGGKRSFDALCDFAHQQGYQVFSGVNLLYGAEKNAAKKLSGDYQYVYAAAGDYAFLFQNDISPPVTALLSADGIEKQAIRILKWMENAPIDGVCVNDVSNVHYADVSAGLDAAAFASVVDRQLSSFAAAGELLLSGENAEMLRDAAAFLSLPFETSAPESEAFVSVPVLPAVLHGSTLYAGPTLNITSLPTLSFLKCVEYGAVPSVSWVYRSGSRLSYAGSFAQTAALTNRLNASLEDLYAVRISGHRKVAEGVYRTDYENGASVFVNYNNYSVNVNSVQIPPYDFIRMN